MKQTINLNGPEGNAFNLLAIGHKVCKIIGLDWKPIEKKMKSGNYDNLVAVFKENFGAHFKLVRR